MANILSVAKQHAIIVLARLGRSQRQIAAQLRIDRSTVKRYIDRELAENVPKPVEDSGIQGTHTLIVEFAARGA